MLFFEAMSMPWRNLVTPAAPGDRAELQVLEVFGGRYWDRTSGFHRVKVALYR